MQWVAGTRDWLPTSLLVIFHLEPANFELACNFWCHYHWFGYFHHESVQWVAGTRDRLPTSHLVIFHDFNSVRYFEHVGIHEHIVFWAVRSRNWLFCININKLFSNVYHCSVIRLYFIDDL